MHIQWFPGHMTKALRMMQDEIKLADMVYYVLDARAPFSCLNPKLFTLVGNKPFLFILNKADIANEAETKKWLAVFSKNGNKAIALNSNVSSTSKNIINISQELLKEKIERYKNKGLNKTVRAMVVGVPNCGKSSLINNLCGKAKTQTGNKPGVTKGKQWVRISDALEVLDTPGTLWPSFDNNIIAENLAIIGSIKDDVVNILELATTLLDRLKLIARESLQVRYKIDNLDINSELLLEQIGKARGCLVLGGKVDLDKAATAFIDDFRKGKLGNITLDVAEKVKLEC